MPEMITDAELVADLRKIADDMQMRMFGLARADLLRLVEAVEARIKQRAASFEAVERLREQRQEPVKMLKSEPADFRVGTRVLPLGSLAEHRRSVVEEARRLLDEPQAVEARYRDGIDHADWEG